jgi:tetratricopeptide (TPR) repeat protein
MAFGFSSSVHPFLGQQGERVAQSQGSGAAGAAAAALFQKAAQAFGAGNLVEAERTARRILADFPDNPSVLHLLGLIAFRSGKLADGRTLIERAIAGNPNDADARNSLGCVLIEAGEPAGADAAFAAALKLRPDYPDALANRARALLALGRADEAVASARRALVLRPDFFDALIHLGNAALELGQSRQAGDAFARAVALQPNHVGAHINLGRAALEHGLPLRAETEFRQAVALAPRDLEAQLALGGVLNRYGHFAEARAVFEGMTRLAPDELRALIGLAETQFSLGEHDAALATYAAARERHPEDPAVCISTASMFLVAGRRADAIEALTEALRLDPSSASAFATLIEIEGAKTDDAMLGQAEELVQRGAVKETKQRIHLHFSLGKALLDRGQAARAFAHLDEGNRLERARIDFSIEGHEQHMREIAHHFPPELFERLRGAGAPSDLPVFVIGMPRSGTTLVEQILAAHPDVWGAGELIAMNRATQGLAYPAFMAGADRAAMTRIGQAYLAEIAPIAQGRARLVDKLPGNFLRAGLIALALPGARIIHCRRDPVDTCLSCYAMLFAENQPFAYDQAELGRYWRAYDALMAHWRRVLPADRFLEVQYEEVVADLEGQARRLVAFAGLPWNEACLAFHAAERQVRTASVNQVRQPIYTTSVKRWIRYAPRLRPLLAALEIPEPAEA